MKATVSKFQGANNGSPPGVSWEDFSTESNNKSSSGVYCNNNGSVNSAYADYVRANATIVRGRSGRGSGAGGGGGSGSDDDSGGRGGRLMSPMQQMCKKCTPISWLFSLFPILKWLPQYDFRKDLSYDLIAGMTVCVMQIPQGMAYAMLANVQPVVGIYMAFFPIIIYSIMGTSKHISMGTFAVTCLMTGKTVMEVHSKYVIDTEDSNGEPEYKYTPEQIATVVSLVTGLFQVGMGALQMGFLCVLLSSDLVSGFTTGAAVHVLTSQVKNLLGLAFPRRNGIFKIPLTYYDIFSHIAKSNVTAIIFSIITLTFLFVYNEVVKPRLAKKLPVPIPIELFTVVVGTLVSRYWITSEAYGIPIVNHIPTGFPAPAIPPLELVKDVLMDSFILAIVAYTIAISMAKIFAAKHDYQVGANQEFVANGASNVVGSLFSCAPISCSLSRSVIQEQVGGRSQLASLFSCVIIVFVLLWIAPFFETLPHCVLSSIIVVALKGMFIQLLEVPKSFHESSLNFLVWTLTFSSTVLLDIEYGLGIGILCAVINLIIRSNKPYIRLVSVATDDTSNEDTTPCILVDANSPQAKRIFGVRIVQFVGSLNFATIEYFGKRVQVLVPPVMTQIPPRTTDNAMIISNNAAISLSNNRSNNGSLSALPPTPPPATIQEDEDVSPPPSSSSSDHDPDEFASSSEEIYKGKGNAAARSRRGHIKVLDTIAVNEERIEWLLLELSGMSSIDPAASKTLLALTKQYLRKDISVLFIGCSPPVLATLNEAFFKIVGLDHFHPSASSALSYIRRGLITRRKSSVKPPLKFVDRSIQVDSIQIDPEHFGGMGRPDSDEEASDDEEEFPVINPTAAYFRRMSKTSLH